MDKTVVVPLFRVHLFMDELLPWGIVLLLSSRAGQGEIPAVSLGIYAGMRAFNTRPHPMNLLVKLRAGQGTAAANPTRG